MIMSHSMAFGLMSLTSQGSYDPGAVIATSDPAPAPSPLPPLIEGSGYNYTPGVTITPTGTGGTVYSVGATAPIFTPNPTILYYADPAGPAVVSPPVPWTTPAPWGSVFDPSYYYTRWPDLQVAIGWNPAKLFEHFINSGIRESRQAKIDWSIDGYWDRYPDLQAAFPTGADNWNLVQHWFNNGIKEGRTGVPTGASTSQLPPSPAPPVIIQGPPPSLPGPSGQSPIDVLVDNGGDLKQLISDGYGYDIGPTQMNWAQPAKTSWTMPLLGVGAALYLFSRLGKAA